jgi:hypothetical protein
MAQHFSKLLRNAMPNIPDDRFEGVSSVTVFSNTHCFLQSPLTTSPVDNPPTEKEHLRQRHKNIRKHYRKEATTWILSKNNLAPKGPQDWSLEEFGTAK